MISSKIVKVLPAILGFLGIGVAATMGHAAPQSLALVASNEPMQLACDGDACSAELTAFCLQPGRFSPKPGTNYTMTEKSRIAVNAIDRDGRQITLAPRDALRFKSLRGHSAMQIALAPGLKRRLGLTSVSITLAQNIVLAPEAVEGDDNPIDPAELALVEKSLRPLGTMVVDRDGEGMAAARVTNQLVNLLPGYEVNAGGTDAHWDKLMTQARVNGVSPMASRMAQNAYDLCRYYSDQVVPGAMRRCMQGQHDRLMKGLNSKYWKAINTGS